LRTQWCFFPQWFGYCLVVDAWAWSRSGTSLWARSRSGYVGLFAASVPVWWFFELINLRTANWAYLGRASFGDVEFFLWSSLSFSTVIPAVFGTAELIRTSRRIDGTARSKPRAASRPWLVVIGLASLAACLIWPGYFFPMVWLSPFLIIDPLNAWRQRPSILGFLERGDWRPIVSLVLAGLVCGFFWEMWNFYSYPKWEYHVPFVDFWHVFEMPALGYGGYIPFSLELFAAYHLMAGKRDSYLCLTGF